MVGSYDNMSYNFHLHFQHSKWFKVVFPLAVVTLMLSSCLGLPSNQLQVSWSLWVFTFIVLSRSRSLEPRLCATMCNYAYVLWTMNLNNNYVWIIILINRFSIWWWKEMLCRPLFKVQRKKGQKSDDVAYEISQRGVKQRM